MAEEKSVPVFILKRLGDKAPTFEMPVTLQAVGGEVQITLTVKALRKTELAALKDDYQRAIIEASVKTREPVAEPEPAAESQDEPVDVLAIALKALRDNGFSATLEQSIRRQADMVAAFVTGWELEDTFNAAALVALEDQFGGALDTIANAYDRAIFQGRLGN